MQPRTNNFYEGIQICQKDEQTFGKQFLMTKKLVISSSTFILIMILHIHTFGEFHHIFGTGGFIFTYLHIKDAPIFTHFEEFKHAL